jgi:hypothetical protein
MASPRKKHPFDDEDHQGLCSTPPPHPKRQKVGDDNDDGSDAELELELVLEFGDDEPFHLDFDDRKLF